MTSPVRDAACGVCGFAEPEGSVVCPQCRTPVDAAQRRVVTLLFADLAGYTALCGTHDPDQVHLLVQPLMTALRALCAERGGVVPGIQGDDFMALFGARTALEDDPARALEAAVQLQRAVEARRRILPELPQLRVGLHVGEVLVAFSSTGSAPSVSGEPMSVASRVCNAAGPGQILVTANAVELIRVDEGWAPPRDVRLGAQGGDVRVRSYEWEAVADVVRGPRWSASSPYVPRVALERALRDALASGSGAFVLGGAGMGKTRLVRNVLQQSFVLDAAASGAFRPSAAGLCAELLADTAQPPEDLMRLLRGGASGGLADESMLLHAAAARLREQGPDVTLFVDDLELLTESEVALLLGTLRSSGLPWVVASREPRAPAGVCEIPVPPWQPEEAERLLGAMLPRASAELRRAVLERAGDCPLYVEQCARLLLENGAVGVDVHGAHVLEPDLLREIPTSMRLFVASRLDLLPTDQRSVLGIASVLGPEPDLALLRHLTGETAALIEPLVQNGFLRWAVGLAGQPELRFSHALVRDVAYDSQPRSRRVEIHRAAAEWYAVLPVSLVLETQAYHLETAAHLEEPDCDLLRRTVEAMVLFARSIEEERTQLCREVLGRARTLAESRRECAVDLLSLELATASVEHLAGEQENSREAAQRALDLAASTGNVRAVAEARLHLARSYRHRDNVRAGEQLDLAAQAYEQIDDRGGSARVLVERGVMAEHDDGLARFLGHLEHAYQEAMRSSDVRLQASCAQHLAMHQAFVNGRAGYEVWAAHARGVSRGDDVGLEPRLDLAAAGLAMFDANAPEGLEPAQRALSAGRDLGLAFVYHNALVVTLDLLLLAGRLGEAGALLPEARIFSGKYTSPWLGLQFDLIESRLLQRSARAPEGLRLLDRVAAHELAAQDVLRRDLAEARAWVALERGRFGEAHALAIEAIAVDEELGERCTSMRPRLVDLVATVAAGETVPLGTVAALRAEARATGLTTIAQLATRWLYVDELTRGWTVDLHGVEPCDVIECRALDLEIEALSSRRWDLLRDAAAVWSELGTTVWRARALLWHSELTGQAAPQADELLITLNAPDGLAETLRAQVRGLRAGS